MADKFLESIKRAREASVPPVATGEKDPASMSDEELNKEISQLEEEVMRAKIRELQAARGKPAEPKPRRKQFPFSGRRRKPWK
jgi:hypothetical protein